MTDAEYLERAEALLRHIEAQCDEINDAGSVDIDSARAGGVITLTFAGGAQIVVNLQKPLHEVWLASRAGGWHYRWTDGAWCDTRTGEHFHTRLTQEASACAGQPVTFTAA
ncbi:MAG: iron donor protein CyaY [Ottowia sp.]|nr:iron donor protein CyaY [Ottowia sp.]